MSIYSASLIHLSEVKSSFYAKLKYYSTSRNLYSKNNHSLVEARVNIFSIPRNCLALAYLPYLPYLTYLTKIRRTKVPKTLLDADLVENFVWQVFLR